MSSALFQPIALRGVTLPNRIVVAPMCMYSAEDGRMTDWHMIHLGGLALSGAGLVIVEATGVDARGRISPGCTGLWDDANEAAMKRVIDACRRYGNTPMGIQLGHAGRKASCNPPQKGGKPLSAAEGAWETVAPSAVPFAEGWHTPRALDRAGMDEVIVAFVQATERAARIGFDVVELHGAHGYLLSEFLSPLVNRRNDDYGGTLENRMRFPLEVFEAVRAAWPADKPLGIRINGSDWVEGGITPEEAGTFAAALAGIGCDFVDVSSGGNVGAPIPLRPGYQVDFAEQVKAASGLPVMCVGMIRDPHLAESIVAEGRADMVALARGALYDPRWPWHAAEALGAAPPAYPPQHGRAEPSRWPQAFPERQAGE